MKDVQGCRMVIRGSSESRQDLELGSQRKEGREQLVFRGDSRVQENLLFVFTQCMEKLSMLKVHRERCRGERDLMMQGEVGKIVGVTYLEHKRRTGLGQIPECYCSYKTAITI